MEQELEKTIALLERTPGALKALLGGLPEEWVRSNEGGDTWSAFDIVVHLIHCDRADWVPRGRVILEARGESRDGVRDFPPFDRWGQIRESRGRSLEEVLDEFAEVRAESLREVRAWELGPEEMRLWGRHPKLGDVTMAELLAVWAAHDLNHLHQMSRVMAGQYREAVGPFAAFLGVLQCEGHGG